MKVKIEEEDFWLHVLSNLPEEYETTVELLSRDLEDTRLTEESEKSMLRAKYKRLQRNSGTSDRALMGTDSKLECRHCGKNGHKYSDCWTFPENKSRMES